MCTKTELRQQHDKPVFLSLDKMTKVVSNKRQLRRLVELLQNNPNIARGICSKNASQHKWEEFALELNSLGPPTREWHKWQRVWADLKCKIKKKKTENDYEMHSTGGMPNRIHHFNDMEEAVIEMLDLNPDKIQPGQQQNEDSLMSGNESLVSIEDVKFEPEEFNQQIIQNAASEEFQGEAEAEGSYQSNSQTEQATQTYACEPKVVENQSPGQKKLFENMTDLMRDVKRSMYNIEDHLKKGVEQNEEILELKRNKLLLYKENLKNQRVDRKAKLKLNTVIVALKKKKYNALGFL